MGYFEIGKIVNTQGLKGEVRVVPFTDDITRFELLDSAMLSSKRGSLELEIENVWYHKNFVVLKFAGIDDMTAAERLKDYVIRIPEELALPLGEDEYYRRDLFGMEVLTEEGELLGVIDDIIATGANDVYQVKSQDGETILIPAIKQCIRQVDVKNKKMTVRLLEGLR